MSDDGKKVMSVRVETDDTQFVSDVVRSGHLIARDESGSGHAKQEILWMMVDGVPGKLWHVTFHVLADERFTADVHATMKVYVARFDGAGPRHPQQVVSVEPWKP